MQVAVGIEMRSLKCVPVGLSAIALTYTLNLEAGDD